MLTKNMNIKRENYNFENSDVDDNNFQFDNTQTKIIHIREQKEEI